MPLFDTTKSSTLSTACTTTSLNDEEVTQDLTPILNNNNDDAELLQRLASRHYYSTTTALGITVGVGCILLVLNMLIFAGIYYQRDRDKKRAAMNCISNGQETLSMTTRPSIKPVKKNSTPAQEPPPSYTTLARNSTNDEDQQIDESMTNQQTNDDMEEEQIVEMENGGKNTYVNSIHKDLTPPKPPTRTTSSLSTGGTIKKRVQIQEITV